ncbi:unnamed protein product [Rodentolepis nana]|uniref:RunxI domain-containing protein n=1 Tax=Rodentolepis nana TaxID=102285 RepID=A0A0R3U028_RODNA|nr:unnamed protein product [Rodentolepis nana]
MGANQYLFLSTLVFKMPWPTDPRFASYFLPGYPAALAAVMAAMRSSASPVGGFTGSGAADYSPSGGGGGGFLSGLASSSASPTAVAAAQLGAAPLSNSTFYSPPWESQGRHLGSMTGSGGSFGSPSVSADGYLTADVQRSEDSGQANAFVS